MEFVISENRVFTMCCVQSCNLDPRYIFALFVYLYDSDAAHIPLDALRTGDPELMLAWRPMLYYYLEAARALPRVPKGCVIYRVVQHPVAVEDEYPVGRLFVWRPFTAAMCNETVLVFILVRWAGRQAGVWNEGEKGRGRDGREGGG